MEKAKAAISDFVSRSGHHDTTVHEAVAPAVQHETIKPHQHEEINTAVDKEVHQDHYHRSVQPVHDREVLPETHTAKLGAVQNREFDHRDHDATKRSLVQDQAQFKNETRTDATTSSRSVAPAVGGEHIHHHIHETIQPVVQKETVQPNVIHTTVPIHEVHHNKATHHDTTSLPAMSMDQFKSKGGSLTGREERFDQFEGIPKNIGSGSAGGFGSVRSGEHMSHKPTDQSRHGDYASTPNHHGTAGGVGGAVGAAAASGLAGHKQHDHTDRGFTGSSTTGGVTGSGQHHLSDRNAPGQGNLTGSSTTGGLTGSGHDRSGHDHLTDRNTAGHGTLPGSTTGTGGLTGSNQQHTDHNHQHGQGLTGKVADATHQHQADRGLGGQGNLTGSSTQTGMSTSTSNNPASGQRVGTDGVIGGVHSSDHDLAHRQNEDGDMPKALVEDKSKAVPHSAIHDGKHGHDKTHDRTHDNTTGSTAHKPSLMDKLNPKVDSDGDGKAGFMK